MLCYSFKAIDSQKSRLIATVRFPPHASVVDVERIQRAIVMNEFEISSGVTIVTYHHCLLKHKKVKTYGCFTGTRIEG